MDFVPRRIRAAGGTILVTPVVAASHPPSLLYEVREGKVESRGIPPAHYEDGALNLLANMSSLAVFDDGRAVVMHEMIVPFGYSVSPAGAASLPKQFAVPLPTTVRSRIHKLPATPLTTKSMDEILTVALTAAADPHTGHLYYLTRSGMRTGGGWEKVIVELDHDLSFVRAARLGRFLPQHMTFVPVRKSLLLTDDEGTWLECKL